jgi:hypothetical protein
VLAADRIERFDFALQQGAPVKLPRSSSAGPSQEILGSGYRSGTDCAGAIHRGAGRRMSGRILRSYRPWRTLLALDRNANLQVAWR